MHQPSQDTSVGGSANKGFNNEEKNNELLRAEERYQILENLLKKGRITESEAAEEANMSVAEFRKLASLFS